jgi:hypothetical protein
MPAETNVEIDLRGARVMGDRAYNREKNMTFVTEHNGHFLGTFGKGKGSPFSFADDGVSRGSSSTSSSSSSSSSSVLKSAKGSASAHWATKQLPNKARVILLASTSGTGRFVQISTTEYDMVGRWSLETDLKKEQIISGWSYTYDVAPSLSSSSSSSSSSSASFAETNSCSVISAEQIAALYALLPQLCPLTSHQRGAEWHLLRKFMFTSRHVHNLFVNAFQYFPVVVEDINRKVTSSDRREPAIENIEKCLKIYRNESPARTAGTIPIVLEADLLAMTVQNLRDFLDLYNLPRSGTWYYLLVPFL